MSARCIEVDGGTGQGYTVGGSARQAGQRFRL